MELLRAGKKKCTVRLGTVSVASEALLMSDGHRSVEIRVLKVDTSRSFAELTDQDALAEGFRDREELRKDLKKYYPGVAETDLVSVIYFEQANSSTVSS
jgi:hypothetical protein